MAWTTKRDAMRFTTRTRRRALVLAVLAPMLWLALPGPAAWAHATLLGSTPPAGYAVAIPPTELTLDYDQPVSITTAPLTLAATTGRAYPLGRPTLSLGNRRLSAAVPEHLADGGYRIGWTVTAEDGDIVSGVITFAVGTGAAIPAGGASGTSIDPPLVILARWVLFAGLALALGGLLGDGLARRVVRETPAATPESPQPEAPRPAVLFGAALGAVAAAVLAVDQVGLDVARLVSTPAGRVLVVELAAFLLTIVLAPTTRTARRYPRRLMAGVRCWRWSRPKGCGHTRTPTARSGAPS